MNQAMKTYNFEALLLVLFLIPVTLQSSLKEIYSLNFNQRMNSKFGYLIEEPKNLTHLGALTFVLNQDLPVVLIKFVVKLVKQNQVMGDFTMNFCLLQSQKRRNIFLRLFFDNLEKSSDIKLKCPLKKKTYTVKARLIPKEYDGFLPAFLTIDDEVLYNLIIFAKFNKQMETVYSVSETIGFRNVE